MSFTMKFDQQVTASLVPLQADGFKGSAVLSAPVFTSTDPTIFSVAADPANAMGALVVGVKVGTATLNASATATELDGTVHTITGTSDITLSPEAPPPVQSVSLGINFGTPGPIVPPTPKP